MHSHYRFSLNLMNAPELYKANYPGQSDARVQQFFEQDIARLNSIIETASLAPFFKANPRLCVGPMQKSVYQIPYSALLAKKLRICGHEDAHNPYWDTETPEIIKEYSSAEEIFADGWLLD